VQAGTVHGTAKNGTTGKPAAGIDVILIQLQGGMQPVINSKTDAQGQFTFEHPSLGAQPMLVRAVYRGVNFHQPVPPGTNELQVEVFDPSQDAKTITVPSHVVIFQPDGASLLVGEEYSVQNHSQPPLAYFRADGNFDFLLPDSSDLQQVSAWGPSGMPVVQATIDRGKNRYAIAFAFRPGESGVRYSYKVPYPGNAATVRIPSVYPGGRLLVVASPTVQVSGDGLTPAGQEQGMSIYERAVVPANTAIAVNLSGTAPPPSAAGGADAGPQGGRDAEQGGAAAGTASIQQIPGRLDVLKWPLVAGFIGVFALGALLLVRKPVTVVASVAAGAIQTTSAPKPAKTQNSAAFRQPQASLAEVDAAVNTSLDSLKDTLFRLELRRQAGTISEEEYARERARAEKILRDLVRG
jgi:Flp pilus assembly protein TadG